MLLDTSTLYLVAAMVAAMLGAMLAGAALAGIAGLLKGTVGAHEVITTIMLNWIVVWVGSYLFDIGGPLQTMPQATKPTALSASEGMPASLELASVQSATEAAPSR